MIVLLGGKGRLDKEKMKKNTAGKAEGRWQKRSERKQTGASEGWVAGSEGRGDQCSGEAEMLDSLSGLETLMAKDEKDGSSCGGAGFWS